MYKQRHHDSMVQLLTILMITLRYIDVDQTPSHKKYIIHVQQGSCYRHAAHLIQKSTFKAVAPPTQRPPISNAFRPPQTVYPHKEYPGPHAKVRQQNCVRLKTSPISEIIVLTSDDKQCDLPVFHLDPTLN